MNQSSGGPRREVAHGCIVLAEFTDHNGIRKNRPGIVLTPDDRIAKGEPLLVMAVTTTFPDPAPRWHVPLPWNPDPRRVGTGLARRSAAVISWIDAMEISDVLDVKGRVPRSLMNAIERELAEWTEQLKKSPKSPEPD